MLRETFIVATFSFTDILMIAAGTRDLVHDDVLLKFGNFVFGGSEIRNFSRIINNNEISEKCQELSVIGKFREN